MFGDSTFSIVIATLIWAFVFGAICHSVCKSKGYGEYEGYKNTGFIWGFFLGIIGLIVCATKTDLRLLHDHQQNVNNTEPDTFVDHASPLPNGFWRCPDCGKMYSKYSVQCTCGYMKEDCSQRSLPQTEDNSIVVSKMKDLKVLLDQGLISQEEYEEKRKELLLKI